MYIHIQYSDICDTYGMHIVFLHMLKVYPEFCEEKSMLKSQSFAALYKADVEGLTMELKTESR